MVRRLDDVTERAWRSAALTYVPVGATSSGDLPEGFTHLDVRRSFDGGRAAFERATAALTTWRVHEVAGLDVEASSDTAALDEIVVLRKRLGPFRVAVPCRVVAVVDGPDRRGFGYGTLPGHPESGEELFMISHDRSTGRNEVRIRAFSRPGRRLVGAVAPLVRVVQRRQTCRYLDATVALAEGG